MYLFFPFSTYYNEKQARVRRAPVPSFFFFFTSIIIIIMFYTSFHFYIIILYYRFIFILRYFCSVVYFNNMDFILNLSFYSPPFPFYYYLNPWFCFVRFNIIIKIIPLLTFIALSHISAAATDHVVYHHDFFFIFFFHFICHFFPLFFSFSFCFVLVARSG